MWTFRPGYLGVTIAVIALLGGVLLGSLLNVSSHNETTTKYDYVSDISGLFDVSDEPQYIDYNPASNYTGYTNRNEDNNNPSGIIFNESLTANNYRIMTTKYNQTAGPSGTVDNSSSYPQSNVNGDSGATARGYITNSSEIVSGAQDAQLFNIKITSMYDWANAVFGNLSQYSTLNVNFTYPEISAPTTRAYIGTVTPYDSGYITYNRIMPAYYTSISINASDSTFTVTGGGSGTYSLFDQYLIYGNASQQELYMQGNGSYDLHTYDTTLSLTYTSTTALSNVYKYMVPSAGVYSNSGTIWDNDTGTTQYDNQIVDILIGPRFNNGSFSWTNSAIFILGTYDNNDEPLGQFTFFYHWSGTTQNIVNFEGTSANIGEFSAYMLRLDTSGGGLDLSVFGVTTFNNYMDAQISPVSLFSVHDDGAYSLDKLYMSSLGSTGLSWSVYNTRVFMDTYGAVLADPSINLANYWPDMSSYRFAFQSFALYGDSITMNGITYPVVNESITIDGRAYKLDNFYLSFSEQGDTSITFNNINRTLSLGATVDKTVSFGGNWGFSTGLYEGKSDIKKVYDWSIKLLGDNLNTIVLIALALVAVMALACKWLGLSLKMTDKIVLGGAGLFLVLLLVV